MIDHVTRRTIRRMAEEMVAADRNAHDCQPATLADPDAGDGSAWDADAIADLAPSMSRAAAASFAAEFRDEILVQYAEEWQIATEADHA